MNIFWQIPWINTVPVDDLDQQNDEALLFPGNKSGGE
jgi:hypothetical protein